MLEYFIGLLTGVVIATLICSKRSDDLRQKNDKLRLQLKISGKKTDDID